MKINLPNQITIGRLLLAIIFFVCLAQYDARSPQPPRWLLDVSAILFVVAGLTDIVDGYLARKHNQVTSFGRVIDPFVDKMLIMGAYILLAGYRFVDPAGVNVSDVAGWMIIVVLGRELLVTSLRGVQEASGKEFAATVYGKVKMFVQSVAVVWVLLTVAHPEGLASCVALRPIVVHLMVLVTLLSVIPYISKAREILAQMSVTRP